MNGTRLRPAILIILVMILINAAVVLYFAEQFTESDQRIEENVAQIEDIAFQNRQLIAQGKQERDIRSDQACELFETDHLQDVQSLRSTYSYISQLTPGELEQTLNRFIIAQLPQTEQQALVDRAPEYCDETLANGDDIGLREPDPKIPNRPPKVVELLGERPDYPTPTEKENGHPDYKDLSNE